MDLYRVSTTGESTVLPPHSTPVSSPPHSSPILSRTLSWARLALVLGFVGSISGCALYRDPEPTTAARPATSQSWERLEESWGPGEFAALLTGTVSSKDQNFWFNVPFASWYVREQDRTGGALLGGAVAYDMVSVKRHQGRAESKHLTSVGFLGIAGRLEERKLDGSREYSKTHWLFPFYRYKNVNGRRTVYPLFIFPVALKDDPPQVGYDPQEIASRTGDPIDPAGVRERRPTVAASDLLDPPPYEPSPFGDDSLLESGTLEGSPYDSAPVALDPGDWDSDEWDTDNRNTEPVSATTGGATSNASLRRVGDRGAASWTNREPVKAAPVKKRPAARSYTVRPGDSLFRIARSVYGDNSAWKKIYAANSDKLSSPDRIKEGMVLRLP